jgi:hypothetical protein
MANLFSGPAGPFPFRIEEWEPRGRHVTVLAGIAAARPATKAYARIVEMRSGQELRLRYSPSGAMLDRGAMNFAVEERDQADHIVALHGLFMSVVPARAAFSVLAETHKAWGLTLRKGTDVIETTRPA